MKLAANLLSALLLMLSAQTASAQSVFPNRPIKILVGFTPGTAPDVVARILADLEKKIKNKKYSLHVAGSVGN